MVPCPEPRHGQRATRRPGHPWQRSKGLARARLVHAQTSRGLAAYDWGLQAPRFRRQTGHSVPVRRTAYLPAAAVGTTVEVGEAIAPRLLHMGGGWREPYRNTRHAGHGWNVRQGTYTYKTNIVWDGSLGGRPIDRMSAFGALGPVMPTSAGPPSTKGLCGVSRTGLDNAGRAGAREPSSRGRQDVEDEAMFISSKSHAPSKESLQCRQCRDCGWRRASLASPSLSCIRRPRVLGGVRIRESRRHGRLLSRASASGPVSKRAFPFLSSL